MSILASRFVNPPKDSQEWNALAKALEEKPQVFEIGSVNGIKYFQVNSTRELDVSYPVRLWQDDDRDFVENEEYEVVEKDGELYLEKISAVHYSEGQIWIECFCPAATPPFDPSLRDLICWLPKICYHMGAVILEEANKYGTTQP